MRSPKTLRGVAAVELAVLLIPLVIMSFGMSELGRTFYYYNGVVKSVRDATRYLSMFSAGENEAQARCLAVHGNTGCQGDPLLPGLSTDMVAIGYQAGVETGPGLGAINLVQVTITGFPFTSLFPAVVNDMVFGPIACTMRQGAS